MFKKFVFTAIVAALLPVNIKAEDNLKATEGSFAAEVNYSFESGVNDKYGLKLRMFSSEKIVYRLNVAYSGNFTKEVSIAHNGDEGYNKQNSYEFSITPGVEYHFNKYNRVSPYVGAEIGFIYGQTTTRTDNDYNDNYSLHKTPTYGFTMGAFTGFDVYITKGFYAGLEIGLNFENKKNGRTESESEYNGHKDENKSSMYTVNRTYGFIAKPALRIGWVF